MRVVSVTPWGCAVPDIVFQTHRFYTEHGQRVAARQTGNSVIFVDIDRGIHGFIDPIDWRYAKLTPENVMDHYDHTRYFGLSNSVQMGIAHQLRQEALRAPAPVKNRAPQIDSAD